MSNKPHYKEMFSIKNSMLFHLACLQYLQGGIYDSGVMLVRNRFTLKYSCYSMFTSISIICQ